MNFKCNHCGAGIHPLDKYCNICGAEAPRKTILIDFKEKKINNPIYCPYCKEPNNKNAIYCSECGKQIYKRPDLSVIFCPKCGEKNQSDAKFCFNCALSFTDWFSMRGEVAHHFGHQGNLKIKEKMTGMIYNFISETSLSIGRNKDNDIVIPCSWISANHCILNFIDSKLIDLDSTNGTFVNRSPERIKTFSIDLLSEFNLAGSFTFKIFKLENIIIFRLGAILDEKECRKVGDGLVMDLLRKIYFIIVKGNGTIYIRKSDGYIAFDVKPFEYYYEIKVDDGFYYFSDKSKNLSEQLILKNAKNLPLNWQRLK